MLADDARASNASDGAWSFRYLIEQMATTSPNNYVNDFINNIVASGRDMTRLRLQWPTVIENSVVLPDITRAPFELLAIVNGIDAHAAGQGELRFVYGIYDVPGAPPFNPQGRSFTLMLTYALPATTAYPTARRGPRAFTRWARSRSAPTTTPRCRRSPTRSCAPATLLEHRREPARQHAGRAQHQRSLRQPDALPAAAVAAAARSGARAARADRRHRRSIARLVAQLDERRAARFPERQRRAGPGWLRRASLRAARHAVLARSTVPSCGTSPASTSEPLRHAFAGQTCAGCHSSEVPAGAVHDLPRDPLQRSERVQHVGLGHDRRSPAPRVVPAEPADLQRRHLRARRRADDGPDALIDLRYAMRPMRVMPFGSTVEPEVLKLEELPIPVAGTTPAAGRRSRDVGEPGRYQGAPAHARGARVPDRARLRRERRGRGLAAPTWSGWNVGDEVFGCPNLFGPGANADYVLLDARAAARKPASVDHATAAALPLVALTAWESLHDRARIQPGQTVLIHAGAGGVGHIAIQLARLHGCRVITTAGRPESIAFCRDVLGADEVIDYTAVDFRARVRELDRWARRRRGARHRRATRRSGAASSASRRAASW